VEVVWAGLAQARSTKYSWSFAEWILSAMAGQEPGVSTFLVEPSPHRTPSNDGANHMCGFALSSSGRELRRTVRHLGIALDVAT